MYCTGGFEIPNRYEHPAVTIFIAKSTLEIKIFNKKLDFL